MATRWLATPQHFHLPSSVPRSSSSLLRREEEGEKKKKKRKTEAPTFKA